MSSKDSSQSRKDHWSSSTYSAAASFVPKLTQKVLQYLDAQPTDRILDVGCGDGKFTANYLPIVREVFGVDNSPSFIESATKEYGSDKAHFKLVDCRYLEDDPEAVNGNWDKVTSNAALHWILRDPQTRVSTLRACFKALRPGGTFVFEMGGAGNVGEVHAALLAVLVRYVDGMTIAQAREASPWFFPSDAWMRHTLTQIGFRVETCELEYRPTRLTTGPGGGLRGWLHLMAGSMLDLIPDQARRDLAVQEVLELLKDICGRDDVDEHGRLVRNEYMGYVRLRCKAWKPE